MFPFKKVWLCVLFFLLPCFFFPPYASFVFLGTDNLAANFSRELADYIIYIIDVSGGDKIPRKGGPGITQADLLVCNLLFPYVLFVGG